MTELMLPTWETLDREKQEAFDLGYRIGFESALKQIEHRIFSDLHCEPTYSRFRPGKVVPDNEE